MTDPESPNLVKIHQDIYMSALSLNAALHNFQKAGGNLQTPPVLLRLLASTELFLKQQPDFYTKAGKL